ncbi:nickel pincer cofactor biosynthesis protein LarB [Tatumella sp. OPLPL6]|uniref:nickel pincer cofactor biosynthesis protein LarB n=1 Tax=Tatumella sp. OPLPL6 TaxID=1928657 RepID=UPI000C19C846|nr:nickel pincer cofactor biosynthesis protein LarB [Tatumella sp. OPLPL6]PIJ43634.1 hypothetical protein BOM24_07780 [Tatumella sp. OPLPL6]
MIKSDIIMDFERSQRCGIEEAVFCEGKTVEQIEKILQWANAENRRLLLTRLTAEKYAQLPSSTNTLLTYYATAQCAQWGRTANIEAPATIAVISGGASDAPLCHEIEVTLNYHAISCDLYQDVGVAALWRLQKILPVLANYDIIIAVAGMEAALPTVLAGLVDAPIIAVPASVGYGVAQGGQVALSSCLASCSGALMTMNIDNGYGAACAAIKIYRKIEKYTHL